jgi:retron-type reverse transcriptase
VVDRLVQHALRLVLEPIFRDDSSLVLGDTPPNKSRSLIPLDLGKFLDETRHELLLTNIARTVKDKNVLDLIQRILRAQCIKDGIAMQRWKGTLLGEPLSALFTRILLDALDRELEKRGLAFSRYPQDSAILLAGEHATLPARSMAYRIA